MTDDYPSSSFQTDQIHPTTIRLPKQTSSPSDTNAASTTTICTTTTTTTTTTPTEPGKPNVVHGLAQNPTKRKHRGNTDHQEDVDAIADSKVQLPVAKYSVSPRGSGSTSSSGGCGRKTSHGSDTDRSLDKARSNASIRSGKVEEAELR